MRKKLGIIFFCMILGANADVTGMSQDILAQIVHGSVNTDPELSDSVADQSVVVSLKSAALNLACIQKNRGESEIIVNCIAKNKPELLAVGNLSESSFVIGQQAATQQAKVHREVRISDYITVAKLLVLYANNIANQEALNVTPISGKE